VIVSILFYEDPSPIDCNVFGVFEHKSDAEKWLENHGWNFNADSCTWKKPSRLGFVEILEKSLK